eukprot:PhM_4_TR2313/c0_g1_i2/m.45951
MSDSFITEFVCNLDTTASLDEPNAIVVDNSKGVAIVSAKGGIYVCALSDLTRFVSAEDADADETATMVENWKQVIATDPDVPALVAKKCDVSGAVTHLHVAAFGGTRLVTYAWPSLKIVQTHDLAKHLPDHTIWDFQCNTTTNDLVVQTSEFALWIPTTGQTITTSANAYTLTTSNIWVGTDSGITVYDYNGTVSVELSLPDGFEGVSAMSHAAGFVWCLSSVLQVVSIDIESKAPRYVANEVFFSPSVEPVETVNLHVAFDPMWNVAMLSTCCASDVALLQFDGTQWNDCAVSGESTTAEIPGTYDYSPVYPLDCAIDYTTVTELREGSPAVPVVIFIGTSGVIARVPIVNTAESGKVRRDINAVNSSTVTSTIDSLRRVDYDDEVASPSKERDRESSLTSQAKPPVGTNPFASATKTDDKKPAWGIPAATTAWGTAAAAGTPQSAPQTQPKANPFASSGQTTSSNPFAAARPTGAVSAFSAVPSTKPAIVEESPVAAKTDDKKDATPAPAPWGAAAKTDDKKDATPAWGTPAATAWGTAAAAGTPQSVPQPQPKANPFASSGQAISSNPFAAARPT